MFVDISLVVFSFTTRWLAVLRSILIATCANQPKKDANNKRKKKSHFHLHGHCAAWDVSVCLGLKSIMYGRIFMFILGILLPGSCLSCAWSLLGNETSVNYISTLRLCACQKWIHVLRSFSFIIKLGLEATMGWKSGQKSITNH